MELLVILVIGVAVLGICYLVGQKFDDRFAINEWEEEIDLREGKDAAVHTAKNSENILLEDGCAGELFVPEAEENAGEAAAKTLSDETELIAKDEENKGENAAEEGE